MKKESKKVLDYLNNVFNDYEKTENKLNALNQHLSVSNQQLLATEQQLRAANQQLTATEQQLRAANQQLEASNIEIRQKEKEAVAAKEFAENIISTLREPLLVLDADLKIITANESFYKTFRVSKKDTLGSFIFELGNKQWNIPIVKKLLLEILPNKTEIVDFEVEHYFDDIGQKTILLNSRELIQEVGKKKMILLAMEDITARKKTEEALIAINQQLVASEQQLIAANQQLIANEYELKKEKDFSERIIETATAIIVGLDKNHIIRIFNKGAEKITGYTKAEILGKDWFKIFFPKEILNEMNQVWEDAWGIKSHSYTNPILPKEGKEIIISWQTTGIYDDKDVSKHLLISIGEDITERKEREKENLLLSTAVTQSPSVIAITDTKGNLEYVNPKFTELTGYTFEEAVGQNPRILKSGELPDKFYVELWKTISSGKEWRGEFHNKKKNGELFWEAAAISPIFDNQGRIINYLKVAKDITERKQAEEQINKDLKIKTALIQELYHRTKNNMAVVSAMLSMESRRTKNEYVKTTFREIRNKIKAMSLVHQKLYKAKDLSNINLKDYIEDLANLILQSYSALSERIKLKFELKDVRILIDSAVPLGLIINELISNIFKHAFPNNQEGLIFVRLFEDKDETINLEIKDNGVGFPKHFDPRKNGSMGLASVFSIVENQLKGEISAKSENGLKWHIRIKDDKKKERV